jgi:hypothetical protein
MSQNVNLLSSETQRPQPLLAEGVAKRAPSIYMARDAVLRSILDQDGAAVHEGNAYLQQLKDAEASQNKAAEAEKAQTDEISVLSADAAALAGAALTASLSVDTLSMDTPEMLVPDSPAADTGYIANMADEASLENAETQGTDEYELAA